jgi:hypothetical protein
MQVMLKNSPVMPNFILDCCQKARYEISRKCHEETWKHLRKTKKKLYDKTTTSGFPILVKI